jgi:hypothetical protein
VLLLHSRIEGCQLVQIFEVRLMRRSIGYDPKFQREPTIRRAIHM